MDWLLLGYLICLPIQIETPIGLRFAPSDLFIMLYLVFGLGKLRIRRDAFSVWHYALLMIFMLGSYMAILWDGELTQYAILQKIIGLFLLILTYIVFTSAITSWEKVDSFLKAFLWSIVVQNCFAMILYIFGIKLAWFNEYDRLSGMLIDPNAYGGLLVVAFALLLSSYFQDRPLIKGVWGILSLFTLTMGILLSFSRSAWIGLFMTILVVTVLRPSYFLRIFVGFLIALLSLLLLKGKQYIDVMIYMAKRPSEINSRINLLDQAFLMFEKSPIFGTGLGTYHNEYQFIIHNTPIWFLTEFGLIGLVVFLGFTCWFFVKGIAFYRYGEQSRQSLIIGLLLAHLAMLGLSLGIEALYQRHWWFIMSIIAIAWTIGREPLYKS